MEIAIVAGMVLAFLMGAYVRKPFALWKKGGRPEAPPVSEEPPVEGHRIPVEEQIYNMFSYTGEKQN